MVTPAWAGQTGQVLRRHRPQEDIEAPSLFRPIKLLDFGFCIPASIAVGVGLSRSRPLAERAAIGRAGFSTCLAGAIAGMAIAIQARHDPSANAPSLAAMAAVTAGLGCVTWRCLSEPSAAEALASGENTGPSQPVGFACGGQETPA